MPSSRWANACGGRSRKTLSAAAQPPRGGKLLACSPKRSCKRKTLKSRHGWRLCRFSRILRGSSWQAGSLPLRFATQIDAHECFFVAQIELRPRDDRARPDRILELLVAARLISLNPPGDNSASESVPRSPRMMNRLPTRVSDPRPKSGTARPAPSRGS